MNEEIMLNGTTYVRKGKEVAKEFEGMKYCIVRTYSAGVFAGYVAKREGQEVTIQQARRIYYWEGAATLSQLAMRGTSKPENCKFPEPVNELLVLEAIEILDCTQIAKESIEGVEIWKE